MKNNTKILEEFYIDFASKVSFFEFIQNEFRNADIPVEALKREISLLTSKREWNIDELSDYIRNNPRSFIIFTEIFQLKRFTNAQLIHFIFDVVKLNSLNMEAIYEYMILNLKNDEIFREIFLELIKKGLQYNDFIVKINEYDKKYLIAVFKSAVCKYIDKIIKEPLILEKRITKKEFSDFSIRLSNYLLNNLKLNEMLSAINVEKFLKNKRIPIDTKSLHGNYPKIKIIELLEDKGYMNIDKILNKKNIQILKHDLTQQLDIEILKGNKKIFCTERYVEGIIKPKDNKLKKFDLIIFSDYRPKYLFEINFYSTEGTKIGINQNEYIDLNNYIKEKFKNFEFYWITDGNYWLTSQGKRRFLNLLKYFRKIYNINLFIEHLDEFK